MTDTTEALLSRLREQDDTRQKHQERLIAAMTENAVALRDLAAGIGSLQSSVAEMQGSLLSLDRTLIDVTTKSESALTTLERVNAAIEENRTRAATSITTCREEIRTLADKQVAVGKVMGTVLMITTAVSGAVASLAAALWKIFG